MLMDEVEFVDKLSGQSMDQSVSSKFDEANFDQNSTSLAVHYYQDDARLWILSVLYLHPGRSGRWTWRRAARGWWRRSRRWAAWSSCWSWMLNMMMFLEMMKVECVSISRCWWWPGRAWWRGWAGLATLATSNTWLDLGDHGSLDVHLQWSILTQQPVMHEQHEQRHWESEGELDQSCHHSAEDTTLDGTISVQSLPGQWEFNIRDLSWVCRQPPNFSLFEIHFQH